MRRLAVFASGSGTNFEAIVTACERGVLDAEVVLMVCDKPGAKVVERAAAHEVGAFVFAPKQYASKADYEREIVARLDAAGVELVCLAGYMRIVGDVQATVEAGRTGNGLGLMINSSRAILYAARKGDEDYPAAARRVARETRDTINLYR